MNNDNSENEGNEIHYEKSKFDAFQDSESPKMREKQYAWMKRQESILQDVVDNLAHHGQGAIIGIVDENRDSDDGLDRRIRVISGVRAQGRFSDMQLALLVNAVLGTLAGPVVVNSIKSAIPEGILTALQELHKAFSETLDQEVGAPEQREM